MCAGTVRSGDAFELAVHVAHHGVSLASAVELKPADATARVVHPFVHLLGPHVPHLIALEPANVLVRPCEHQLVAFDSLRGTQIGVDAGVEPVARHPLCLTVDAAASATAIGTVVRLGTTPVGPTPVVTLAVLLDCGVAGVGDPAPRIERANGVRLRWGGCRHNHERCCCDERESSEHPLHDAALLM